MRVPLDASPALLPTRAGSALGVGVELVDVQQTVPPAAARRRDSARAPSAARRLTWGKRPEAQAAPPVEVETVTRWLRLE